MSDTVVKQEHAFAQYVRILGKGKTGTRNLQREEARDAFRMMLTGNAEPLQIGAFLMLLRVKEESGEELAGFVDACRDVMGFVPRPQEVDLDWSSYAGKKNQQPWYLLSALLLAANGIKVCIHGADGHTPGRVYTGPVLERLGIKAANSIQQAQEHLRERNFAWLPLANFCPQLHEMMQYRHLLGLRSPVNTLARLLNPLGANSSIQSVFHPAYARLHLEGDALLQQPASLVFKGEGGEVEIKPHATTDCQMQRMGTDASFSWQRSLPQKPESESLLGSAALKQLWRDDDGQERYRYGRLATVHTAAVALLLLDRASDQQQALQLATDWWQQRERNRW
ncbi:glycosyl transferase family protein [Halieaceae bacterium IMCC14734]|uniref:Glycosyl transferase family protein n=1 Tax=Candidatus Litorirhabdus singularis TaxID=2518993 RepID=A0ABT3TI16_9GAMM|nr:glycosyl transferase family protein [Candidatus Litorirhabdus singularis]MCX2981391.1 glycosyl transferase family protein [Candidatus Litorirhabdus singularis]